MPANGRRGRPQGKCHREETANPVRLRAHRAARVKRWGKSPPRDRQRKRHGKPHREQDQIGVACRATGRRVSALPPGSVARGARQRASQRNGHLPPQGGDRTRLTGRLTCVFHKSGVGPPPKWEKQQKTLTRLEQSFPTGVGKKREIQARWSSRAAWSDSASRIGPINSLRSYLRGSQ